MTTTNNKKPDFIFRDGPIKAAVWWNPSEKSPKGGFHNVQFTRTWKDEHGKYQTAIATSAGICSDCRIWRQTSTAGCTSAITRAPPKRSRQTQRKAWIPNSRLRDTPATSPACFAAHENAERLMQRGDCTGDTVRQLHSSRWRGCSKQNPPLASAATFLARRRTQREDRPAAGLLWMSCRNWKRRCRTGGG
jgi:hypothetical protein